MSAVDWVKLELHLGNVRQQGETVRLPDQMSITTLADLGDTSPNRHRIYHLNKACSADIPGRGEFSATRSTLGAGSRHPAFGQRGK